LQFERRLVVQRREAIREFHLKPAQSTKAQGNIAMKYSNVFLIHFRAIGLATLCGAILAPIADSSNRSWAEEPSKKTVAKEVDVPLKRLKILRLLDGNWEELAPDNKKTNALVALPGELINLKVEGEKGKAPTKIQWTIKGTYFKSYECTNSTGKITPVTATTGQEVEFCWSNTGDFEVSVAGTVGVDAMTQKATISVKKPTYTFTGNQSGRYRVILNKEVNVHEVKMVKEKDNKIFEVPATFGAQVQVPQGFGFKGGQWMFGQTITKAKYVLRVVTPKFGAVIKKVDVDPVSDAVPYSVLAETLKPNLTNPPQKGVEVKPDPDGLGAREVLVMVTPMSASAEDNPDEVIGAPEAIFGITRTTEFSMFLFFKPAGAKSQFVALAKIDWQISYEVKRDFFGQLAVVKQGFTPGKLNSVEVTKQPEWVRQYFEKPKK